jgi:predicted phage terminase large subunit-like protein
MTRDNKFVIGDVTRGRWSALERERIIKQTAEADRATYGWRVKIYVEQEPGSAGKESAEATVRMLAGHNVKADRVTGSKEDRAGPYAAQVQAGNIALARGAWNRDFLDEHESFPAGKFKDQVDAASGAFNNINKSTYDTTYAWWDEDEPQNNAERA